MNPRIQLPGIIERYQEIFWRRHQENMQVWHPYMLRFSCRVMMEQIFRLQTAFGAD